MKEGRKEGRRLIKLEGKEIDEGMKERRKGRKKVKR
jgi:hypothetical protein